MLKRLVVIGCLVVGLIAQVNAQNKGVIKGIVTDEQGQALPFASVILKGIQYGVATKENGRFAFSNVIPGKYQVQVSTLGFELAEKSIEVKADSSLDLSFQLVESPFEIPQLTIIASRDRVFSKVPGSVSYLDKGELSQLNPVSGNEVFRRVAGVNVVDEEGAGLRANIGIRGLDPDRSRNVLILEDGIPVALNPYGEPDAYYTPSIDRMEGVEVLKGSGQILYGPRTIGGVLNYITANPPSEEEILLRLRGGENGYFSGLVGYGNTFNNTGVQFNFLRKQADQLGYANFDVNDFTGKVNIGISDRSELSLKFGLYREKSNATYVGLTQSMYDQGGQDFVLIAPNDRLLVDRNSISLAHDYRFNQQLNLQTLAYAYTTTRNWRRQDFSYDPNASNQTGVVWGDTSIPGGAIYMRNGTGNRNRQFAVAGFEQRINYSFDLGTLGNDLTAGYRYIYEKGDEQRINGAFPTAVSGELVQAEDRTGDAISVFIQDKLNFSHKFSIDVGLRFEHYQFERHVFRGKYNGVVKDTSIINSSQVSQLIPGIGFNYQVKPSLNVFGGIHRGFAPPRVKDAITAAGEVQNLDAELSWNYELGLRTSLTKALYAEFTGFFMDFSNQIIPVSESSGGTGAGLINGGQTKHEGVEIALFYNLADAKEVKYNVTLDLSATYQKAYFASERFQSVGTSEVSIKGNHTPYAPDWMLSSGLTISAPFGVSARITNTYVGQQYTDPLNTITPSNDGRDGKLASYLLTDLQLSYTPKKAQNMSFTFSVKNLTNERYISSRRPQGIRVGTPRFISAGMNFTF